MNFFGYLLIWLGGFVIGYQVGVAREITEDPPAIETEIESPSPALIQAADEIMQRPADARVVLRHPLRTPGERFDIQCMCWTFYGSGPDWAIIHSAGY